jgi:hypothetical protein
LSRKIRRLAAAKAASRRRFSSSLPWIQCTASFLSVYDAAIAEHFVAFLASAAIFATAKSNDPCLPAEEWAAAHMLYNESF